MFCADMAVQNVIGDAFRGATWVSLHNGGGVGWGEVINGGFGMVLDGTADADRRLTQHAALGREQRHRPPRLGPQPGRRVRHRGRPWSASRACG